MRILKSAPIYLFLFPVFFCLHGAFENFGFISVIEVSIVGISILCFMAVFWLFIFLCKRDISFAALVTLLFAIFYFFFGAIYDFLKLYTIFSFLHKYSVLTIIIIFIIFLWIIFLLKNKNAYLKIALYFNALFLIFCIYDFIGITYLYFNFTKKKSVLKFDYRVVKNKPNVYFLLFDEYPGERELSDSFNFDNTQFTNFLTENKFISLPIYSNYDMTEYSMASMLNMNYIKPAPNFASIKQSDFQKRQMEIKYAAVFETFENMGYTLDNNSFFDIHNLPGISNENSFVLGHGILLTDKIYINRINRDLGMVVPIWLLKYFPFLKNKSIYKLRENNITTEKKLIESLNVNKEKPIFSYTHFLMPHGPYFFDSLGNPNNADIITNQSNRVAFKSVYISYLKYVNKVAQRSLLSIKEKDSAAVIIMMSDHGFRTISGRQFPKHFRVNNICKIYFPNNKYDNLPDTITNVNFFKFLFNNQFNQKLEFLSDSTFLE